jgi:hypothetical protein
MTSPNSDPFTKSPEVEVLCGEESFTMTWNNTTVRQFGIGEGTFDHIVMDTETSWLAFRCDETTRQYLIDLKFPRTWSPILDEDAIECIAMCDTVELETEMRVYGPIDPEK